MRSASAASACDDKMALLYGMVENVARVPPGTLWFTHELKRMHDRGMSFQQIGRIMGKGHRWVSDYIHLAAQGERTRYIHVVFVPHHWTGAVPLSSARHAADREQSRWRAKRLEQGYPRRITGFWRAGMASWLWPHFPRSQAVHSACASCPGPPKKSDLCNKDVCLERCQPRLVRLGWKGGGHSSAQGNAERCKRGHSSAQGNAERCKRGHSSAQGNALGIASCMRLSPVGAV